MSVIKFTTGAPLSRGERRGRVSPEPGRVVDIANFDRLRRPRETFAGDARLIFFLGVRYWPLTP